MGLQCDRCLWHIAELIRGVLEGRRDFEAMRREVWGLTVCVPVYTYGSIRRALHDLEREPTGEKEREFALTVLQALPHVGSFCQREGMDIERARREVLEEVGREEEEERD